MRKSKSLIKILKNVRVVQLEYENITKNYKDKIPELKIYNFITEEQFKKNKNLDLEKLLKKFLIKIMVTQ